ncbi:hypothetical protein DH2020_004948 [Rehmannia glutinosa]|uniref:CCHC-type domain-containing protein n=1 Tax=Rehmannia glutinosa TaxID=99300 RepID=A0ABR0XQX3_REHGL
MACEVLEGLKRFSLSEAEIVGVEIDEGDIVKSIWELGHNLFQFVFHEIEDKDKVFNNRVWSFDNQYLILREWVENMDVNEMDFSKMAIWIQIWNIPNHWISSEAGLKVGGLFTEVQDVFIPDSGIVKGRCIKLLALIDLAKPLLRGTHIRLGGVKWWVNFKYENLMGFCFYCGFIGHIERGCNQMNDDLKINVLKEGEFGEWLKAEESSFLHKGEN